nr:uncharacterized protein LOC113725720 isoform X2 [Coffea arabica]
MQQSQARQVHKELQDTISQLEAICHEIRTISFMNPGPLTRSLVENAVNTSPTNDETGLGKVDKESISAIPTAKGYASQASASSDMHSQAIAYAKLAESKSLNPASVNNEVLNELTDESGLTILPVSAESAGLLPNRKGVSRFLVLVFASFCLSSYSLVFNCASIYHLDFSVSLLLFG